MAVIVLMFDGHAHRWLRMIEPQRGLCIDPFDHNSRLDDDVWNVRLTWSILAIEPHMTRDDENERLMRRQPGQSDAVCDVPTSSTSSAPFLFFCRKSATLHTTAAAACLAVCAFQRHHCHIQHTLLQDNNSVVLHKERKQRCRILKMKISRTSSTLLVLFASVLSTVGTSAFVVPSPYICSRHRTRTDNLGRIYTVWNIDEDGGVASPRENAHDLGPTKDFKEQQQQSRRRQDKVRAVGMATTLAAGTVMAWNGDISAAGAMTNMMDKVPTVAKDVFQQAFSSSSTFREPAVTLPYLEDQIRAAEESLYNSQPAMTMADATTTTVVPTTTTAAPKPAAPAVQASTATAPSKEAPKPASPAPEAPKPAAATATTAPAPAAPKPAATATAAAPAPAAPKPVATAAATTTAAQKPPAATATTVAAPKPVAATAAKAADKSAPSLYRYTRQHWPEWVDATKMAYRTAEPLVMSISRDVSNQLEKKVLPEVVRVEHRILGDEVAGVVDKAAATAFKAGKLAVGVVGKAVPVVWEAGKLVIKATPEVIKAGQQVYNAVDKQVIPELKKDYRVVKKIVEEKTPQVIRAGRQVYETGKQLAHAVEEDVLPKFMEAEKKLAPKINQLEHRILGDSLADPIDKTVDLTLRTGRTIAKAVNKNAPAAFSAAKKTINGAVFTGKAVVKGGQQVYHVAEEYVPKAYRTTKNVVLAVDRTGGQIAYVIDAEAPKVAAAIKKEIPKIRETGGRMQRAVEPVVVQLAESGKAITADVVTLYENLDERDQVASVAAVGIAATAIASAATSEDSFLIDAYGRNGGTSISESSGGFPSLFSRSGGGYVELSRRRF
jgi:hypothetical protein